MAGARPMTYFHSTPPLLAWERVLEIAVNRMLESEVPTARCMMSSGGTFS